MQSGEFQGTQLALPGSMPHSGTKSAPWPIRVTIPRAGSLPGRLCALRALRASSHPVTLPLGPPADRARQRQAHEGGDEFGIGNRRPAAAGLLLVLADGQQEALSRAAIFLGGVFHRSPELSLFLQKSATGLRIAFRGVHKASLYKASPALQGAAL